MCVCGWVCHWLCVCVCVCLLTTPLIKPIIRRKKSLWPKSVWAGETSRLNLLPPIRGVIKHSHRAHSHTHWVTHSKTSTIKNQLHAHWDLWSLSTIVTFTALSLQMHSLTEQGENPAVGKISKYFKYPHIQCHTQAAARKGRSFPNYLLWTQGLAGELKYGGINSFEGSLVCRWDLRDFNFKKRLVLTFTWFYLTLKSAGKSNPQE